MILYVPLIPTCEPLLNFFSIRPCKSRLYCNNGRRTMTFHLMSDTVLPLHHTLVTCILRAERQQNPIGRIAKILPTQCIFLRFHPVFSTLLYSLLINNILNCLLYFTLLREKPLSGILKNFAVRTIFCHSVLDILL